MRHTMRFALALTAVICHGLTATPARAADPRDALLRYEWVGNIDQIDFNEPSGLVYHHSRGTLFVVGDNGDLCEIEVDGEPVRERHLRDENADLEGVTFDPSTGLVYVVVEEPPLLLEVEPDSLKVLREIPISRTLGGDTVLASAGQGLEGLTFVADASHPHGGRFFVTNQAFDLGSDDDVSALIELAVPLRNDGSIEATPVAVHRLGIIDLAGVHYDGAGDQFLVVSDATNSVSLVSTDGQVRACMALPGQNQEGITLDAEGHLYIAQDSGGIVKLRWLRPSAR